MPRDEVGTLARLKACRAIVNELIASHRARIFNAASDSGVAVRHLFKPRRATGGRNANERYLP
jgi:hypothetical protein